MTAKRASIAGLVLLLAATALLRLPCVTRPLVGHFATKNVVYAMIARNWATGAAPWWHPTLDCLADGQPAWHLLEIPVSAYAAGALWNALGGSLDVWGRTVSIVCSVASVWLLFLLVRRWHSTAAAWGAAVALAISPVSIIYGQSMMLEASLVTFLLATFLGFDVWFSHERGRWLALAAGAVALGLLLATKIYMLAMLVPLAALSWNRAAKSAPFGGGIGIMPAWRKPLVAAIACLLAALPSIAWHMHVYRITRHESPSAARVYYSIENSAEVHRFPSRVLATADFYRQWLDDLTGPVAGPIGFSLLVCGLMHRGSRRHVAWIAGAAAIVLAMPLKFLAMQYYHMVLLPLWCVLIGLGWELVAERLRPRPIAVALLLLVAACVSLRHAALPAFSIPAEDRSVVAAAEAVRRQTDQNEPIVAIHGSTLDLLYYSSRRGWAPSIDDPELPMRLAEYQQSGARWLVIAGLDDAIALKSSRPPLDHYELAAEGAGFRLYRLDRPTREPLHAARREERSGAR